jgi:cellulose synthase/poly-beta-1,6-N-acetylglucosamine synthase-like glycosyltransferase
MDKLTYYINWFILTASALGLLSAFVTFWCANVYDFRYLKYRFAHAEAIESFNPTVTIIVPAFNEEKSIVNTLNSLCANAYQNKQIVVVDDGSTDNTLSRVQKFIRANPEKPVQVIHQKNGGKSVAINNALFNLDTSELTMVLDADSELRPDAITRMVKWFWNPKVIAMAMNVKMTSLPTLLGLCQRYEFVSAYRGKCAEHVLKILYIIGGIGSTFRTSCLKSVGGYETDTPTEDIDLTLKLLSVFGNNHWVIGYANDAVAFTQPVSKFKSLVKQRYRWKYGRFVSFMKYRHLFFKTDRKLSKMLTWFQLPRAIAQEFFMLVEPYVFLYLLLVVVHFQDWRMLFAMVSYVVVVIGLSTISSKETIKSKMLLLLAAPFDFLLSYVLTVVEYVSLLNSFAHWKTIIHYQRNHANWNHVERL